jgi:hypothetical protein
MRCVWFSVPLTVALCVFTVPLTFNTASSVKILLRWRFSSCSICSFTNAEGGGGRHVYPCTATICTKQNFLLQKMAVFWVVAPCSLVDVYQRFRGPCCLHHQGLIATTQETAIFVLTAVRTSNPTSCFSSCFCFSFQPSL